jgi:16S rRNA (cytosine1402-N4)-methyltransferase
LLIHQGVFSRLRSVLENLGITRANGFLFDLGVSSHQFDTPARGFSYRMSGPLDMRMDPSCGEPVGRLLERVSQNELSRVLFEVGQVRNARRFASRIAGAHLRTTADLRGAVEQLLGHEASPSLLSKIFMALRIWVNREFEELAAGLDQAFCLLAPEGRIVVLSYHSGEDRIVKNWMRERSHRGNEPADSSLGAVILTKKPVFPSESEAGRNPRARSARLRAIKAVSMGGGDAL